MASSSAAWAVTRARESLAAPGGWRPAQRFRRRTSMTFHRTVESYQAGARTMPGERYTSDAVLGEERERIFARGWNCVGRASRLGKAGDFIVRNVAGESIIILRDRGG